MNPPAAPSSMSFFKSLAAHVGAVGGVEQHDEVAVDDAAGEGEVGHVGAAPRPVDGEEAEARDGEASSAFFIATPGGP
jgi:hypothetical protein